MFRFVIVCVGFLTLSAQAQPLPSDAFVVTGSAPENGAISVAESSQVTFTFSAPLDASARFDSGLPVAILDPGGTIRSRIVSWSVAPDGLSLTLDLTNPADSDLAIVITGAKRDDGESLCAPFAFNYTTRSAAGTATVSGVIGFIALVKRSDSCGTAGLIVIAALYDAPIDQGGNLVRSSIAEFGPYGINHVGPGMYWPYYFLDSNNDGEIDAAAGNPEMSFYDGNGDGVIDQISTESGDVGGIDAMIVLVGVEEEPLPPSFTLWQAYPNPFNPTTTITYTLHRPTEVRVDVHDLIGKRVRRLEVGFQAIGDHTATFDAAGLPSGIYFYTLTAGGFTETRRMVLMK